MSSGETAWAMGDGAEVKGEPTAPEMSPPPVAAVAEDVGPQPPAPYVSAGRHPRPARAQVWDCVACGPLQTCNNHGEHISVGNGNDSLGSDHTRQMSATVGHPPLEPECHG